MVIHCFIHNFDFSNINIYEIYLNLKNK